MSDSGKFPVCALGKVVSLSFAGSLMLLLLLSVPQAGVPVQDFSSTTLGLDYSGALRGIQITKSNVMTHERVQRFYLRYAPSEYTLLGLGAGISRLFVDRYNGFEFEGKYRFSPGASIDLYTPSVGGFLRLTAGGEFSYARTADGSGSEYRSILYSPSLGLKLSPIAELDIEGGLRWYLLNGWKRAGSDGASTHSNSRSVRGYGSLTLHSPMERAYLSLDIDLSPDATSNWSSGPAEATIGVRLGFSLAAPAKDKDVEAKAQKYFPEYKELLQAQDQMIKALEK